jgi:glycosyl transferase family 87
LTAAIGSCVLFAVSFYVLQRWLEHHVSDVLLYQHYATLVRAGRLPYHFAYVYPPASLPVLLLPAYLPWSYATSFAVVMGVCGAGCIAAAAAALRTVGASSTRTSLALVMIGISPLVLGSLFEQRFDLWPTLLAVTAIAALLRERSLLAGGLLGLGFAAKLWPAILLPLAIVYLWRRRGGGVALRAVVAFVVVSAACFVPFAILAPHGLEASLRFQLDRPLQVESLGAALLMAARHLGVISALVTLSRQKAQLLRGTGTGLAADLSTAVEVAAVVGVWIVFARRKSADRNALLLAAATSVAALVAFDKVLSPQYLIWLVPTVALIRGRRGLAACVLLLIALGLTQTWFPWNYPSLAFHYASPWSWLLLTRDTVLVALVAALAWPARLEGERLSQAEAGLEASGAIPVQAK